MIRPRLSKVASGTRLTTDLINGIINRIEYAADLLRQYKLTAGADMYVEPHYDGTRVSYYYPVKGGATPRGSTIPITSRRVIEIQPGITYTILAEGGEYPPFQADGTPTIFTLSQIAYTNGIIITGGTWQYFDTATGTQNTWKTFLYAGFLSPYDLSFIGGFRAQPGKGYPGIPYWQGGTIQIYGY